MDSDLQARRLLGTKVRQARRAAGFANTAKWADRVGRSDRVLLGLERGEAVGADTYAAVADALGWPLERIYSLLDQEDAQVRSASPTLTTVSDEELAAEVLRRMKSGGEHGGDTAATNVRPMSKGEQMQQLPRKAARPPQKDRP